MSSSEADVVVVGAGIMGSATAYHLVNRGAKVVLLEQFDAQHGRGSSHGCSRITRRAYAQSYYVRMMEEAFRLWAEVERKSGKQLYIPTGILMFGEEDSEVSEVISSLGECGVEHEVFSGAEANRRYPQQLKVPPEFRCVMEKDGGILLANKCWAAFQHLFQEAGGVLLDNHKVIDIVPGPVVTVVTNKGTFRGKKVVVTAGAWTGRIMAGLGLKLPLKAQRGETFYWKLTDPEHFSPENFPIICRRLRENEKRVNGNPTVFIILPAHEYPGLLKVAGSHSGPMIVPDDRDAHSSPISTEVVSKFIGQFLKGVSTTPSIYEPCIYTDAPDDMPIVDRHPVHRNIIFAAGFAGHGFKEAPVMGKLLCELALDLPPSYDLTPLRADRFENQKSRL